MIIRFSGNGNIDGLKSAIKKHFGEHTPVLEPISVTTPYTQVRKIRATLSTVQDVNELVKRHGFTRVDVPPRTVITHSGDRSEEERRELAGKYYFITSPERRAFAFTSKVVRDKTKRFDGSFLGDAELEAALPELFTNYGEPEWYAKNSDAAEDYGAAYKQLLDLGFTELVPGARHKHKVRNLERARKQASRFYFARHLEYGSIFIVTKKFWDKYEKFDDQSHRQARALNTAFPPGFHEAAESEYHYRNSSKNPDDLTIGCELLLAVGFTELPQSVAL